MIIFLLTMYMCIYCEMQNGVGVTYSGLLCIPALIVGQAI